tara:strand:- start:161 stop:1102 length:942 start_codon:yes stop_codon:yes gene_type:complete
MKNLRYILFALLMIASSTFSQKIADPSMMILPYTSTSGESAIEKYENDVVYRSLIQSIQAAFIEEGAEIQDLAQTLKNLRDQEIREGTKITNIDDAMNKNASSEVIILAEVQFFDQGGFRTIKILMQAIETATGNALYVAQPFDRIPKAKPSADFSRIASQALRAVDPKNGAFIRNFLNGMNSAFNKMVEEGRSVNIVISTDNNSDFLLSDEANDDFELIGDKIDEWVEENTKSSRKESSSDNRYEYTVKIPVRDADDKPYSVSKFAKQLRIAVLKTCKKASETMGDGEKVDPKSCQQNIVGGEIRLNMPSYK